MEVDSDEEEDTGLENYSLDDDLFSQEEPKSSRRVEPLSKLETSKEHFNKLQ